MVFIRSLLFNIYFPVWTFGLATFALPFVFCPPKVAAKIGYIWSSGIMIGLRLICGIKYEVRGSESLPKEPFILAVKHQSAWETAIFLKLLNAPVYILKKELLKIPLFGRYLVAMDMVPVDRQGGSAALKEMVEDIKDRLDKKHSVVIFPEGTRTAPGQTAKYHSGIAFIYKDVGADIPVIPVALNSGLFWGRNAFTKRPGKIIMQYLPPVDKNLKRKEFLSTLQDTIEKACAAL